MWPTVSVLFPFRMYVVSVCFHQLGVITHEIGHALGLWHQHQQPDRDKFIKIYRTRIDRTESSIQTNFDAHAVGTDIDYGVAYDMGSVMHYANTVSNKWLVITLHHPITQDLNKQNIFFFNCWRLCQICKFINQFLTCRILHVRFQIQLKLDLHDLLLIIWWPHNVSDELAPEYVSYSKKVKYAKCLLFIIDK